MASNNDLDILAWTMLGEAGGEGPNGMGDVGHVILNRLETGKYGSSISEVARANKQFSTWNTGEGGNNPRGRYPKNSAEFKKAREIAEQVVAGAIPGPPGKPLDYHTPDISPYWADSKDKFGTYERNGHLFYASVPVPPGEIPNAVGTALSTTRPPVTGSPTPMPPMLAAQRNLQPTTQDTAPLYRGIYPQAPAPAPRPASQPSMVFGSGINDSFAAANAASSPDLAASLASYLAPKAPTPAMRQPSASERSALAYVAPPKAPSPAPRQPNSAERSALAYVAPPQAPRITTVASIPTTPAPRAALPPIPPSNTASPRMVETSMQRAAAAQDPRLVAALAAPQAPPAMRQPSASERAALAYVSPPAPVNPRIGQPPATRAVASVPVKPAAPVRMNDTGAPLPSFNDFQTAFGRPSIPGPSAPPKIGDERLVAGEWGVPGIKGLPTLPGQDFGVGTALSVMPPMPRPRPMQMQPQMASVPLPRPRPAPVQQAQQRRPLFALPTPLAQRPAQRAPLNVTVYANSAPALNPSNHNAAQLAALANGQSTFVSSPGAVSEPVRAMNGKVRNTY